VKILRTSLENACFSAPLEYVSTPCSARFSFSQTHCEVYELRRTPLYEKVELHVHQLQQNVVNLFSRSQRGRAKWRNAVRSAARARVLPPAGPDAASPPSGGRVRVSSSNLEDPPSAHAKHLSQDDDHLERQAAACRIQAYQRGRSCRRKVHALATQQRQQQSLLASPLNDASEGPLASLTLPPMRAAPVRGEQRKSNVVEAQAWTSSESHAARMIQARARGVLTRGSFGASGSSLLKKKRRAGSEESGLRSATQRTPKAWDSALYEAKPLIYLKFKASASIPFP
jgi:hypothetical protein